MTAEDSRLEKLRYPIGRFRTPEPIDRSTIDKSIERIEELPHRLKRVVSRLDALQLDTPYRDGGWTVRQVVHHLADSHVNAYVRIKLALTESNPTIRPYDEVGWAELADGRTADIRLSMDLLDALHGRWCWLLERLPDEAFQRPLFHPDSGPMTVGEAVVLYAWHGHHHVAHITTLVERRGWK